jgi:hypothetical protein
MTFLNSGVGYADEFGMLKHFDIFGATVTHSGSDPACKLMKDFV